MRRLCVGRLDRQADAEAIGVRRQGGPVAVGGGGATVEDGFGLLELGKQVRRKDVAQSE